MDESRFWAILEAGRERDDDPDEQLAAIRTGLVGLSPDDLIGFQRLFDQKMDEAYRWGLWGAAYLINGGASYDGFAYFRCWLISQGGEVFARAVRDPDSLAGHVDPDRDDYEFEDLWHLAGQVYEEAMGAEMPPVHAGGPAEPSGDRWDFEDDEEIARRLPRLARLYE